MATQTDALASLRRLQGSDSSRIRMEHERRQPALRKARSWFGLTRDDAVDPSRDANSISNPDPSKFNNTPNHSNSPRTSKHVPGSASVPKSSSDSPPVASRTLKQKSSLASLKDFAGYFNPWSPVSPASPQQQEQEHDIELLRSPQSESSESSLEHTPDQTCDISFEIEQISRERASAWVKAVTPPSAPPIPARSRQRSATIGLGIQTNPNSQVTPYSPSAAAAASAAQPMLSQTFALMFPGHRFDAYSNTHQRCLRHASSLPTLRHHHTSSSPPSLVASNKSSASSASSMISASSSYSATQHRHPKLLKKAQSFAAMRARPLQPLVTLEQELAKSSNPDARTSNTPSFFQKLLKNPSQAALQIRPHTRKTGIKKPDSRSNNNTRRSELPVITDENQPVTKKGSRDQENKTGFKSKAHNTLQRVMSKNKQSPTLPWSVGIVPPADVARRPKHSLIGSTGPIRGPRPAKLARAPLPRIIVDDYDEDE